MARARAWSASFSNLLNGGRSSSPSPPEPQKKDGGRLRRDTFTSISEQHVAGPSNDSPPPQPRGSRPQSRPMSILQPYQPPTADVEDTLPELQLIFQYLNNHSNKMYTEGYFLKLTDLTPDGKPSSDRSWQECFAQLVGTVLSLWDAAELDAAGSSGEVVPTFLNLTDASIKMIDKLPTRSAGVPPLTNVLSISTAGRNRYLFHFNSHHSLVQWTASIRLSMFELSKLQEIYTGALISGKGRDLNAIGTITARTKFKYEEWVRVRFGAGTPWRKCWAVITQPDEKAVKKAKAAQKKANKSAYQSHPILKGEINFYDSKKIKKVKPIATITEAYSAFAIYPQSKQLIDQSTLVKIEGRIRIHGDEPTESEGYVFVMPEIHPAVSGFETMLRWLFPTFDTFCLYGRPGFLIPNRSDPRSLMFGMPREGTKTCGYLEVVDVVNLIVAEGNSLRMEFEWRERLKNLTAEKIRSMQDRNRPRTSLPVNGKFPLLAFNDGSPRSSTSVPVNAPDLPPSHVPLNTPPLSTAMAHQRSVSESAAGYMDRQGLNNRMPIRPLDSTPESSQPALGPVPATSRSDSSSDDGLFQGPINPAARTIQTHGLHPEVEPVPITPITTHPPSSRPNHPMQSPAAGGIAATAAAAAFRDEVERRHEAEYGRSQSPSDDDLFAGVVPPRNGRNSASPQPPVNGIPQQYQRNVTSPVPPPPAPPAHIYDTSNNSQNRMSYHETMEPPPGFSVQSSHVLMRGPPPTEDRKVAYEEGYANRPPPGPHPSQRHSYYGTPSPGADKRFSWQPDASRGATPGSNRTEYMDPLPSPPIPQKVPFQQESGQGPPPAKSNSILRKPVPHRLSSDDSQRSAGAESLNSLDSLALHLINEDALQRIGNPRMESYQTAQELPVEEDTVDRRTAERMRRLASGGADSDSEYGDEDSEPDYASIDTMPKPPKRDIDEPRAGRMKVVGQDIEPTPVVVGDTVYRPKTGQEKKEPVPKAEIPKVDFGMTMNHGRSLSTDLKGVTTGNGTRVEPDSYPASQHGTMIGDPRRLSANMDTYMSHNRSPSRASMTTDDRRQSWNRPSPDRNSSQGSDSDNQKRRSMVWQPGMAQLGATRESSPSRALSAEQYVKEKAAAAAVQQETRSRYVHKRRSSGQLLHSGTPSPTAPRNVSNEHLPTRPSSRGGNAAFTQGSGFVSTHDLSQHLSAREQEMIAKQTGSSLLHLDSKQGKPPAHTVGLIGAIDKREQEKQQTKEAWQRGMMANSMTLQQAIMQRQQQQFQHQQQQQQQRQREKTTPSPRPLSSMGFEQASYFPPQPQNPQGGQQYYQSQQQQQFQQLHQQQVQQQLQQHQQMQQGYGYGGQQQQQGYQGTYYGGYGGQR